MIKFSVDSHDEDEAWDVYNGILDIEDCYDPVAVQNILESEIDPWYDSSYFHYTDFIVYNIL